MFELQLKWDLTAIAHHLTILIVSEACDGIMLLEAGQEASLSGLEGIDDVLIRVNIIQ